MSVNKTLTVLLLAALLAWGIEALVLHQRSARKAEQIRTDEAQARSRLALEFISKQQNLEQEFVDRKHLATGKTVFDRIFNTQGHSISELIQNIASEALPDGWTCDVRVEEFTNFILLVYLPRESHVVPFNRLASYFEPLLKYCSSYLTSVAVFDGRRKSYLFLDETVLDELKSDKHISTEMIRRAEDQGQSFTRFNSVTLECKKRDSHLFLPIEVVGPNGVVKCEALFDTGATTTMLSNGPISKTGDENRENAPRRSFSTPNGLLACPIVSRGLDVGGLRKTIEIAVNENDTQNLLGRNFFEGMEYIVDFQVPAIYVWEK